MLVVQWRTVVSSFDGEDCDALVSLSQKLQMSNLGDSQLGGRRTSPPHGVPDRYRFLLGAGAGVEKGVAQGHLTVSLIVIVSFPRLVPQPV